MCTITGFDIKYHFNIFIWYNVTVVLPYKLFSKRSPLITVQRFQIFKCLLGKHQISCFICLLNQAFRGSLVPSLDVSSPMVEATVWTPWTSRMTPEAGTLIWTWSSSTSIRSTGSLASSYSASFATSSSLLFDSCGSDQGAT